jgi:CTP synthase
MKTKPTQYAARTLNSAGVFADIIIARSPVGVDEKRKEKIAQFCNVKKENVISAPDVKSVYDVPINFEKDGLSGKLCDILDLSCKGAANLTPWKRFVSKTKNVKKEVRIAVVGKYFSSGDFILSDVYISVLEAIKYSAYAAGAKPVITYLSSVDFEKGTKKLSELSKFDGILIPGGFGATGVEGKIKVIEYARTKKIPYFGICYGMQLAVIEYARNVLKLKGAHTAEIDPKAPHTVIDVMTDQKEKIAKQDMGGTMRLGEYQAVIAPHTHAAKAYGAKTITERHRHRYEVNPEYIEQLEKGGVVFSGKSPSRALMEIMELPKNVHPFFVGVQFHPEFHARPLSPHPIFSAFIKAALVRKGQL